MSDHVAPTDVGGDLLGLVTVLIRQPDSVVLSADGLTLTYHFNVDLTAAQATRFGELVNLLHAHVRLDLADFDNVKADYQTAKAFVGIATPTQAQTAAALKAVIRVLGAVFRN